MTHKFIVEMISEILQQGKLRNEHCCSQFASTSSNIHIVVEYFHNSGYRYDLSWDARINEVFCKLTLYSPWHSAFFMAVRACKLLYSGWEQKSKGFILISGGKQMSLLVPCLIFWKSIISAVDLSGVKLLLLHPWVKQDIGGENFPSQNTRGISVPHLMHRNFSCRTRGFTVLTLSTVPRTVTSFSNKGNKNPHISNYMRTKIRNTWIKAGEDLLIKAAFSFFNAIAIPVL